MDAYKQIYPAPAAVSSRFEALEAALELQGVTTVDLLVVLESMVQAKASLVQLAARLGRSVKEIEEYLEHIQAALAAQVKPQATPSRSLDRISTGLKDLDCAIDGGIGIGVTEVFGSSGCGKSQLLFQIALESQLVDPQRQKVVIVNTESFLETKRLKQMLHKYSDQVALDNIEYIYCQDLESQDHTLHTQLPIKLQQEPQIRTIIIDSIGHHLRRDDAITNCTHLRSVLQLQEQQLASSRFYVNRGYKYKSEAQLRFFRSNQRYENITNKKHYIMLMYRNLARLCAEHQVSIVVANQVSDQPDAKFDATSYAESRDPLDYDYQIGIISGWDPRTIYNYHRQFLPALAPDSEEGSTYEQLVSTAMPHKRRKLDGEQDPRYIQDEVPADDEERLQLQSQLVQRLYRMRGYTTRRHVPSLGYAWGRFMSTRLCLQKTYKPQVQKSENLQQLVSGWQVERYVKVVATATDQQRHNSKIKFTIASTGIAAERA